MGKLFSVYREMAGLPYKFRWTLKNEEADKAVLALCQKVSPGHLGVLHEADEEVERPHWHFILYWDKSPKRFRQLLKEAVPTAQGQSDYSFGEIKATKVYDSLEAATAAYERYMCHGKCEGDAVLVVSAVGVKYTPEWFRDQNKAFYAVQKAFMAERKKKELSLVEDMTEHCRSAGISGKTEIAVEYCKRMCKANKPTNVFHARGVVNTVWMNINGMEAIRTLAHEIANC